MWQQLTVDCTAGFVLKFDGLTVQLVKIKSLPAVWYIQQQIQNAIPIKKG